MRVIKISKLAVSPKFKEKLKIEAALNGDSMIGYTEKLAEVESPLHEIAEQWKKDFKCKTKRQQIDLP